MVVAVAAVVEAAFLFEVVFGVVAVAAAVEATFFFEVM